MGRDAPRILSLVGDETGCSLWRIWAPFAELTRRGYVADWAHKDKADVLLPRVASGYYDAIVTPRIVWPKEAIGDNWINAIHRAGVAWIYEADDDFYSPRIVDRQMRLFATEAAKGTEQLEWERLERIRFLDQCDGMTVSSPRLKTIVHRYTPNLEMPIHVVANYISANCGRPIDVRNVGCCWKHWLWGSRRVVPPLTIGWAGGTREEADLSAVAAAWTIIAERYPHVRFVVQGYIPEVLYNSVPAERRHTLPWLPLGEYPRALLNIDIGCCAVAPLVFNTAKTCIKWYEMTLAGAVCVVSPTLYGREATDDHDALVADTTQEWVAALSRLIEDETLRRRLRRNARRTVVEKYSLQNNWWRWLDAYADVIERFRARPRLALPA